MNNSNYPSCIKVPAVQSKQQTTPQRDLQSLTLINYELISVANRIFGPAKWNHSVTSQTLDYVESFLGKIICGCVSFVKVQLADGSFHEDIGYYHGEGITKASAIQLARTGSVMNAFEKVLICFGNTVEVEVKRVMKKFNSHQTNENSKDLILQCLNDMHTQDFEPCAQSTPYISSNSTEKKIQREIRARSKSPLMQNENNVQSNGNKVTNMLDPNPPPLFPVNSPKNQKVNAEALLMSGSSNTNQQKKESNEKNGLKEDQEKVLNEDFLRSERKRKQMEKQAEYKRLLKEKELQKAMENRKFNTKY